MSERKKQADFLKGLLACGDHAEHQDLSERIKMAERDECCMKRACRLIVVVTLMALAVLGYLTVLKVPDDMTRLSQFALRFCQALALGSVMCLGVFVGLLCWHRALINRLFTEGRKIIATGWQHVPSQTQSGFSTVIVHEVDTAVYHVRTDAHNGPGAGAEIISLRKAS